MLGYVRAGCLGIALLLLATVALEARLPEMTRPFWEDEIHHNWPILSCGGVVKRLADALGGHNQPILEYLLRMVFWFPLLGCQERALRLPSLFYSLGTVGAGFGATFAFLRRRQVDFSSAFLLAFFAGAWIAWNPSDVYYAAEARHYAFVSLVSVVWCGAYCLTERRSLFGFGLLSLAFANTHFFALPLIATAFALEIAAAFREANFRRLTGWLLVGLAILVITRWVNVPAWRCLTATPPGGINGPGWGEALVGGAELWWQFLGYLGGSWPLAVAGVLLCLLPAARRPQVARLLLLVGGVLPAFLVYVRLRSQYEFYDRYYTPFFGLGLTALALFLQLVDGRLKRWFPDVRSGRPLAAASGIAAALVVGGCGLHVWQERQALRWPPRNFSPYWVAYEGLKAEPGPLFILREQPSCTDVAHLYMERIGRRYPARWEVHSAVGEEIDPKKTRRTLAEFLAAHPQGVVIFDRLPRNWCDAPPPPVVLPLKAAHSSDVAAAFLAPAVEEVRGHPNSFWKVTGAKTPEEVGEAARMIDFQAENGGFSQ